MASINSAEFFLNIVFVDYALGFVHSADCVLSFLPWHSDFKCPGFPQFKCTLSLYQHLFSGIHNDHNQLSIT